MEQGKWQLVHGCHRGTLMSRDEGMPSTHNTRDEAYQAYLERRKFYRSIGYHIWYAKIISPTGEVEQLESNPYW